MPDKEIQSKTNPALSKSLVKYPCLLLLLSILFVHFSHLYFSAVAMPLLGGVRDASDQNSAESEELARFAVQEHNKKANTLLEFSRAVKTKVQVVAGTMYSITLEVVEAGQKKIYEAKVWVKPWENFKELQEFNPVGDSSSTSSVA